MFNFTPLLGAQSTSHASQSLLEFDGGVKVLIDVGWDESFDVEKLKEIEKYVVRPWEWYLEASTAYCIDHQHAPEIHIFSYILPTTGIILECNTDHGPSDTCRLSPSSS